MLLFNARASERPRQICHHPVNHVGAECLHVGRSDPLNKRLNQATQSSIMRVLAASLGGTLMNRGRMWSACVRGTVTTRLPWHPANADLTALKYRYRVSEAQPRASRSG